jgi:hypothetical protein
LKKHGLWSSEQIPDLLKGRLDSKNNKYYAYVSSHVGAKGSGLPCGTTIARVKQAAARVEDLAFVVLLAGEPTNRVQL